MPLKLPGPIVENKISYENHPIILLDDLKKDLMQ